MELAIVVTAFFPIPSKFPPSFYLEMAGRFLKNCPAKIIIFTISKYASYFKEIRGEHGNLIIYEEELDDIGLPLETPVKNWIPISMWEKTTKILNIRSSRFCNTISIQLMILYLSKAWFVQKAISKMGSEDKDKPIFWHDIGSAREKEDLPRLRGWPSISKLGDLSDNKIRFFRRMQLPNEYLYDCDKCSFIAGSHMFGNIKAWSFVVDDLKNAVLDNINKYEDGVYDETVYLKLALLLPERYTTIGPNFEWYKTFILHGDTKYVLDIFNNSSLILYSSHDETNQVFLLIYTEDKQYFSLKGKSNSLVISDKNGICFEQYDG